ncbi:MAG: protein-disulfide reductase DsbD [Gammaproteobacteria bacterium]|nr:protein-disulfide reductase DsbD [Gammaproteobacteria bacterium]
MVKTTSQSKFALLASPVALLLASVLLFINSASAIQMLGGENEFLPVDKAFQVDAYLQRDNQIQIDWQIAEGYYLYRKQLSISTEQANVTFSPLTLPTSKTKTDDYFGEVQIYETGLSAFSRVKSASHSFDLIISYQGCAHAGLCYPPVTKIFNLSLSDSALNSALSAANDDSVPSKTEPATLEQSEQGSIANQLKQKNLGWTVTWFFLAGLLLALTPCVFPMIPILSSIIAGQGEKLSASRGFSLSLVYVLAMALTYTIAGILVGMTGANIQAWFQDIWIISAFALVFVVLSLSMFGLYELQMPSALQSRINALSGKQQSGSFVGTAIMGFLSALIVGPCVTAPLIGALLYIAESGDPWVGGLALFSLSIGMGLPLLLIGTSAGKYLPRAGGWMEPIKAVFGVMLLALAIWFVDRVYPRVVILALSGGLLIGCAIFLDVFYRSNERPSRFLRLRQTLGWILLTYGSALLLGASAGNQNLLQPLAGLSSGSATSSVTDSKQLSFKYVKGMQGLEQELALAAAANRPVMLDMYADWCIACKELEAFTFNHAEVHTALRDFVILKADVTANDEVDNAMLKELSLFGPPGLLFFDTTGKELRPYRIVGFIDKADFLSHLERLKAQF